MVSTIEDMRREMIINGSVVTLRDVLNILDTRLSDEEIDTFIEDVVAQVESEVRPGELITADLMNTIMGQIASLNERLTILEHQVVDNRVPIITDIKPRPVRVGQRLEVSGYNFPLEAGEGTVELDNVLIERFIFISSKKLIFGVPRTLIGLPKDAILRITNGELSASDEIHVQPEQNMPEGRVTVQDVTPALGEIIVGNTYTLEFEVRSTTNIPESYGLNLTFTGLVGSATVADWQAASQMTMEGGSSVPDELLIVPGFPATVLVTITIPDGAESGTVTLNAISVNNPDGITSTPASIIMVVGEAPAENDPRTTVIVMEPPPTSRVRVVNVDGVTNYEIPYNDTQSLFFEARYQFSPSVSGTYQYSARLLPDNGPWQSLQIVPESSIETVPSGESLRVQVTLPDISPDPAHAETRTLEVSAMHVADGNAEEFISWTSIIIRGYERVN